MIEILGLKWKIKYDKNIDSNVAGESRFYDGSIALKPIKQKHFTEETLFHEISEICYEGLFDEAVDNHDKFTAHMSLLFAVLKNAGVLKLKALLP